MVSEFIVVVVFLLFVVSRTEELVKVVTELVVDRVSELIVVEVFLLFVVSGTEELVE